MPSTMTLMQMNQPEYKLINQSIISVKQIEQSESLDTQLSIIWLYIFLMIAFVYYYKNQFPQNLEDELNNTKQVKKQLKKLIKKQLKKQLKKVKYLEEEEEEEEEEEYEEEEEEEYEEEEEEEEEYEEEEQEEEEEEKEIQLTKKQLLKQNFTNVFIETCKIGGEFVDLTGRRKVIQILKYIYEEFGTHYSRLHWVKGRKTGYTYIKELNISFQTPSFKDTLIEIIHLVKYNELSFHMTMQMHNNEIIHYKYNRLE